MTTMQFSVATIDDAPNLTALSIEVWLHTYAKSGIQRAFSNYVLSEFSTERFTAFLKQPSQMFIKCESGENLLGYIRIDFDSGCPTAPDIKTEIVTLYVQEHFARKGIGRGLLQDASVKCYEMGIDAFWLSANCENDAALRFYDAQNFKRNGSLYFELDGQEYENFILYRSLT